MKTTDLIYYNQIRFLDPISMCVCVCARACACYVALPNQHAILRHKLHILPLKSIVTLSLRVSIWFYRLRVLSFKTAPLTPPASDASFKTMLLPVLLTIAYKSEVLTPSSLGFTNLLEWLKTQRKITSLE